MLDTPTSPCHNTPVPRLKRLVVPGCPHHVTQRGVRSLPIFTDDADRDIYIEFMRAECARHGNRVLAWCLMTNHVHLIAAPEREESLALGIGWAHRRYTRERNFREGVRGRLFQGRFYSYPLDERHLMLAARYVELNPMAAGVARAPEEYPWSSAAFHLGRRRKDPLVEDASLGGLLDGRASWRRFLRDGVEEGEARRIESRLSSGLPLGTEDFVKRLEEETGRVLTPRKGGWPKGKRRKGVDHGAR